MFLRSIIWIRFSIGFSVLVHCGAGANAQPEIAPQQPEGIAVLQGKSLNADRQTPADVLRHTVGLDASAQSVTGAISLTGLLSGQLPSMLPGGQKAPPAAAPVPMWVYFPSAEDDRHQLEEKAHHLREKLEQLEREKHEVLELRERAKSDEQHRELNLEQRKLNASQDVVREELRDLERELNSAQRQDHHHGELHQQLEELQREHHAVVQRLEHAENDEQRERGRQHLENLEREMEEVHARLREHGEPDHPEHDERQRPVDVRPEHEEFNRRIHALHEAAERLAVGGLNDMAHELHRRAEELEQQIHANERKHSTEAVVMELMVNMDQLRHEVREVNHKLDVVLKQLNHGGATPVPAIHRPNPRQPEDSILMKKPRDKVRSKEKKPQPELRKQSDQDNLSTY